MDLDDFDVEKSTAGAWTAFTANLTEVLSVMDDSSDLTISAARADGNVPAVRFSSDGRTVEATIVGGEDDNFEALGWDIVEGVPTFRCDQEDTAPLAELTTKTMQDAFDVIHPVFLEPDQLKEILQGDPLWDAETSLPARSSQPAIMPTDQADLDHLIDEELAKIFGHPPLRNPQGDVAIRVGSAVIFLRSTPDASEIMLFSPLVNDVSGRSRACEVLNDLNVESRYGRFALHKDRVYVQVSVAAAPFVATHLHHALQIMSQIADGIDDDLAEKLGGRTTFPAA